MAKAKGELAIVGFRRAASWGVALACGAGHGLEVLSVGVKATRQIIPDNSITGRPTTREGDKGNLDVNGPMVLPLRYEGAHRLIAQVLGLAGVPATVDTSGRKHVFKIADQVDSIFGTLAYEAIKDTTVFEFNTVKLRRLTLRATIPGRIELEVEMIGHDFTDASAINTTTTIDTVTVPANREIAQARQMVFRMNGQGGAGLAAGDARFLSAFELTIERPLETDFTTEFGDRTSEPMPPEGDGAAFSVSGSLTFSQLQTGTGGNSAFVLEQLSRTLQKADLNITGDNLAGAATQKFAHILYLPMLVLGDGKPVLAKGRRGWQLPFTAHHVSAIPTGFPAGYTDAVTWENYNQDVADALA